MYNQYPFSEKGLSGGRHMKKNIMMIHVLALLLATASAAFAAGLFPGYSHSKWGTDFLTISKIYRNGNLGKIGDQLIYKQVNPDRMTSQRTFGFRNEGLNAVSITFGAHYVRKVGAETMLERFIKSYGEGTMDRSSAPHLISYFWEDATTRITFAFSETRPDMTVLMFQQKN